MYAIDRKIERLQTELDELNQLKDDIEEAIEEKAEILTDEIRDRIGEIVSDIIYEHSSITTEMLLDDTDLEQEMLEELSDKIRMNF